MPRLSPRVRALLPSATVRAHARARELAATGALVLDLTAGEPDQRGPAEADVAVIAAIEGGETRYGPAAGLPALRARVAARRPVAREPGEVLITAGAKQALHAALQAVVQPGDEVLLPTPCWVSFAALIELAGGVVVPVPASAERSFVLDPAALEAAITPRTRVLVLNSPSNPTGAVLPTSVLEAVGALAARHDLWVVSDEIYAGLVYDGQRAGSPAELGPDGRRRTVVVDGVSKSWAMTGWRVGWAVGPAEVIEAMSRFQSQTIGGPSPPNQRAALAALAAGDGHRLALLRDFQRRRDRARAALLQIPGLRCHKPAGAIYLFPDISPWLGRRTPTGELIDGSVALQAWLLEEAHVALVAGAPFGADRHLRLSIAAPEETLLEAIERLATALSALR